MRVIYTIIAIVALLALGKIYVFKKPEEKGGMGGPSKPIANAGNKASKSGPSGGPNKPPSPPVLVDVYVALLEHFENNLTSSGTIIPNEEVELRAETSGRLMQLNIREGAAVQKGQLIAKLKDDDLKAQLKKVEFEETLAKKQEERQKKLLNINAISKEEYDITANKINTLSADIELIKVNLEKTEVRAPFSGKIGLKSISLGAYVSPTTTIATLVQTNPVKIDFTVPEKYTPMIRVGQSIKFSIEGDDKVGISARIIAIDPKIDPNGRTLRVRAQASNTGGRLVPGMFVKVDMNLAATKTIMIPTEAIVPVLKGKKVFVVENGRAVEKMIETGIRNDRSIQVTTGLSVGDSLIISGLMAVKKESEVKIKKK